MGDGFGQAIWGLLIMAMWGAASVVVFVAGSIISIWVPIPAWQLALFAVVGGAAICFVFWAVYRP